MQINLEYSHSNIHNRIHANRKLPQKLIFTFFTQLFIDPLKKNLNPAPLRLFDAALMKIFLQLNDLVWMNIVSSRAHQPTANKTRLLKSFSFSFLLRDFFLCCATQKSTNLLFLCRLKVLLLQQCFVIVCWMLWIELVLNKK